jgi:hypothetical protein
MRVDSKNAMELGEPIASGLDAVAQVTACRIGDRWELGGPVWPYPQANAVRYVPAYVVIRICHPHITLPNLMRKTLAFETAQVTRSQGSPYRRSLTPKNRLQIDLTRSRGVAQNPICGPCGPVDHAFSVAAETRACGSRRRCRIYIYLFFLTSNKSWSTWSTRPLTRMDTGPDVDTRMVHAWSTHGPH